jgi:hypothetical protein
LLVVRRSGEAALREAGENRRRLSPQCTAGIISMHNRSLKKLSILVTALIVGEAITVATIYFTQRAALNRDTFRAYSVQGKTPDRYEVSYEAIQQPPTHAASAVRLRDDEEVIGIEVGSKARAYRISAMQGPLEHIINDLIDGVPVTVSYCNVNECVRAFTDAASRAPLDISQAGLKGGERMLLRTRGVVYLQDSREPVDPQAGTPPFPYHSFPATRITWKAWRQMHPDTDVYIGVSAR